MWNFSWIAIVLAALSGFLVGGIWYGPLFLKPWLAAEGKTMEDAKTHAPTVFGLSFLLNLLSAFILAHVFRTYGDPGVALSVMIAVGLALGFVVPAFGVNYLFAGRRLSLFLIDAGYWIVAYSLMGLIFGLFAG
ncbi:DUF1761 domain-containing protein [Sphingomonas sp. LaA6.9]|uniref:DUF1761 domain-containing protein n=1 Tax=Sphingomonas sp. LaA6.9 TaxID=2919914 RepID=UPI001F4F13D9|nr:DUF1761 domain-containing protein [Sphingomonas sp. LaA6.9]MCJ8159549.1 DUF1761 domain-containing protein [Sphingomonas sp. LaA6.9]